ncbi:MAG: DUF89 family protein [Asgard group archaeon]|nr:DUF89 family protein [Asgard group archaeon]
MPNSKCLGCLKEITAKAIKLSTQDKATQKKLEKEFFSKIDSDFASIKLPEYSTELFAEIADKTGINDPFLDIKIESNLGFKKLTPMIIEAVESLDYPDKLRKLFLFAIGANMVDFSTGGHSIEISDIVDIMTDFPSEGLEIDHFKDLWNFIQSSKNIIYLSDNCGEAVVDNLIVEILRNDIGLDIYLGLKDGPIANDCMINDFTRDGLPEVATETFAVSSSFGWNLHQTTDHFKNLLSKTDLLIVKGQSNYETTLNNILRYPDFDFPPIFCILRTKCKVITKHLGVPLGSNIIKQMYPISNDDKEKLTEIVDCI